MPLLPSMTASASLKMMDVTAFSQATQDTCLSLHSRHSSLRSIDAASTESLEHQEQDARHAREDAQENVQGEAEDTEGDAGEDTDVCSDDDQPSDLAVTFTGHLAATGTKSRREFGGLVV